MDAGRPTPARPPVPTLTRCQGEAGLWTEPPGEVLSWSWLRQKQRPPQPPPKLPRACHSFPAALPDHGAGTRLIDLPEETQRASHVGAVSSSSGVPARDPSPRSPRTHTCPNISERECQRGTFGSSGDTLLACPSPTPRTGSGPMLLWATLLLPPHPAGLRPLSSPPMARGPAGPGSTSPPSTRGCGFKAKLRRTSYGPQRPPRAN